MSAATITAPSPVHPPLELLTAARRSLLEAAVTPRAGDRYTAAHLAALRAATAVLAARTHAARIRRGPSGVWALLANVAPEFSEWAEFFAAGSGKRTGVETGLVEVTEREANDLLRDAESFCARVAAYLERGHSS